MYQTRATYNPQNQNQKNLLHEYAFKTINTPLIEPFYKLTASTYLVGAGFTDEGLIELNKLHNQDPRNLDTLNFLAGLSEEMGKINDAVNFRMKIVNLDPWNAKNYLALSRDYKKLGELENARKMVEKIKSFASMDPIALQAVEELNS
jgi:tetratricopeptide (TPR) repeat protein